MNDDARKICAQKSNGWHKCLDVLQLKGRQSILKGMERKPHQYQKQNAEYWTSEIFLSRQKRRSRDAFALQECDESQPNSKRVCSENKGNNEVVNV